MQEQSGSQFIIDGDDTIGDFNPMDDFGGNQDMDGTIPDFLGGGDDVLFLPDVSNIDDFPEDK